MNFLKSNNFIKKIDALLKRVEDFLYEIAIKTFNQMLDKLKIYFKNYIYLDDSIQISREEELVRLHKKNKFKSRL